MNHAVQRTRKKGDRRRKYNPELVGYKDAKPVTVPEAVTVIRDDNSGIFQPDQISKIPPLTVITPDKEG
jgi:hypothetical protein